MIWLIVSLIIYTLFLYYTTKMILPLFEELRKQYGCKRTSSVILISTIFIGFVSIIFFTIIDTFFMNGDYFLYFMILIFIWMSVILIRVTEIDEKECND